MSVPPVSSEISQVSKRAGVVGIFTFLSRFFGLARDSIIAKVLGASIEADAFYLAFRIPNLFRRLLAEGSLTISFIPVFTEYLKKDKTEAKRVADFTFTLLFLILFLLTLIGVIGASFFVYVTAPGFSAHPEKFALATSLTRITFPYIFLVSLGALAMGILNSLKHFSAPAASPILLNIGIISGAVFFGRYTTQPSMVVAIGVLVGGTAQLLIQIPSLIKLGFLPRFSWNPTHPGVKQILKLILPSVYGSSVYQINLLYIQFMGSFLPTGSISLIWYADRVMEFPLGVFAISLATVILPQLSSHASEKNMAQLKKTFREGLLTIGFINLPAAVGLISLSHLIIAVLFERGRFSPESTHQAAQILQCSAIGLPFVSGTRVTASAFYATQDTKGPVKAANWAILANIVTGLILIKPLGAKGLVLGVAMGSVLNFVLHLYDFRKKMGLLGLKKSTGEFIKILTAALGMGIILHFTLPWAENLLSPTLIHRLLLLIAMIVEGVLVYACFCLLLKVQAARPFLAILRRKLQLDKS